MVLPMGIPRCFLVETTDTIRESQRHVDLFHMTFLLNSSQIIFDSKVEHKQVCSDQTHWEWAKRICVLVWSISIGMRLAKNASSVNVLSMPHNKRWGERGQESQPHSLRSSHIETLSTELINLNPNYSGEGFNIIRTSKWSISETKSSRYGTTSSLP